MRGLLLAGLLCLGVGLPASNAAEVSALPARQVIVVFKTHFDLGYTDMASNVIQRYRTTMIDEALRVLDRNRDLPPERQFAWTLPGWPLSQILADWPGQTAERRQRIFQAFRGGRFVVHALPFTTHTELLELEDLVRGLGFSSRLARAASLELPRDAKMTDVPCHSWILPTLLRHAGVDFLHLGCNAASRSPEVPRLFWWEGPDGSRLLTMYTAESYGTGLVPPADWPYRTWLALIHTGDNHGPPTPEEVQRLFAEAREKLPGVPVRIGRLSDFADGILAENADVPVVRGDMPDTWIHGPMCDPQGASLARNDRPQIATIEALNTCLRAWGSQRLDTAEAVARAYEKSLLYGEHTWGGALYWVSQYTGGQTLDYGDIWKTQRAQGKFGRLESSWEEHTDYIREVDATIPGALRSSLQSLAVAVGIEGRRIVVFNPLPWTRDGQVSLATSSARLSALKAVDGDEVVPVQQVGTTIEFVARDVPPMGYRTFVPVDTKPAPAFVVNEVARSIENASFRVTLDPGKGCLRSVIDKRSGKEWVEAGAPQGFGQVLYERFDVDQVAAYVKAYVKIDAAWATNELGKPCLPPAREVPYRTAHPVGATVRFEQGPAFVRATLESTASAALPFSVRTEVTLYRDLPWLDLAVTVTGKPADPWPEAGWVCFPFAIEEPQFQLGRLGSIVDPAQDLVSGANRHLLGLNLGMTLAEKSGAGFGLCALDSPLVSLDEPGCWKYSKNFVPKRSRVYFNLFNNQWTTNFRLWNEATWTSRFRLWTVRDPNERATQLVQPSWEARLSLLVSETNGPAGSLPPQQTGVELSQPGVIVTAFGPNPDGNGTLLRLWELAGRSGRCTVRLPDGLRAKTALPVDLRGRPIGPVIPLRNGRCSLETQAFAPVSLLLL